MQRRAVQPVARGSLGYWAVMVLAAWLAAGGSLELAADNTVPAAINYQGRLADAQGAPVPSGYYEIQFRIWDDPTATGSGNLIWSRLFPIHVTTNGLYNVLLSNDGGTISTETPKVSDILQAFEGPTRYLGMTVTRNTVGPVSSAVEMSPRQRLVTAPYAMHSYQSTLAQNATWSSYATNAGSASAAVTATNALKFASFNTNDFLMVNKPSQTLTGSLTITSNMTVSGNMSIGTIKPEKALTVDGDMELGTSVGDYHQLRLGGGNSSGYLYGSFPAVGDGINLSYNIYHDAAGTAHPVKSAGTAVLTVGYGQFQFRTAPSGTPSIRAILNSSGQMGIGTIYPETPLHVSGATTAQVTFQENTTNYRWKLGTGNDGHFYFGVVNGPVGHEWKYGAIHYDTGNYVSGSDRALKKDIEGLEGVLDRVLQLHPVSFRFKTTPEDHPKSLGFIAQEVEPLFPEVVCELQGYKGLAMSELVPVAIGGIQELNGKVEQQNAELRVQATRIEALERSVADLQALVIALGQQIAASPK